MASQEGFNTCYTATPALRPFTGSLPNSMMIVSLGKLEQNQPAMQSKHIFNA